MLCNAVARGLILRWIPRPEPAEEKEEAADRSRKASEKNHERADIIQSFSVDPRGLPDIKAALEVQTPRFRWPSWSAVIYYNSYKLNHRNFCQKKGSQGWRLLPPQVVLRLGAGARVCSAGWRRVSADFRGTSRWRVPSKELFVFLPSRCSGL